LSNKFGINKIYFGNAVNFVYKNKNEIIFGAYRLYDNKKKS